ncbi:MAG: phospholipid scramblase-related protein [Acidobacteriota bacterium]
MDALSSVQGLVVSQKKEWGEIVTGFETRNKYAILDTHGNQLYMAVEEEGSTLLRWFLKAMRPFQITVRNRDDQLVLRVVRPFRFFFHELDIFDSRGQLLGTLQRRFALLRRIYSVLDSSGRELFQIFGPILHPWTFEIKTGDNEYGKITKKWSGLLIEGFTDADNFGVSFPAEWDKNVKALFLGAVFLIDFVHFENTGN